MGLLLIAAGGAVGALLRYAVHRALQSPTGLGFPIGTLVVNVLGCALIGVAAAWLASPTARPEARLLVITGLLGGFTTFSTFGLETIELLRGGRTGVALLYVAASNTLGIGAVWLGFTATAGAWR